MAHLRNCYFLLIFHILLVNPQQITKESYENVQQVEVEENQLKFPVREDSIRRQRYVSKTIPFPCFNVTQSGLGRSFTKPTSVHRLRPGDIDVIGSMGDSLMAGSGALEEYAIGNLIEHRGVSWCSGGQDTWRKFLTLPNILKEFNPNLKGYSTGAGGLLSPFSKLNVAFPVAADADALKQAKYLLKKMKNDKSINMKEDWKMITIFFGANDLCSAQCYDKTGNMPEKHAKRLMLALDYLQENMPRAFINLIPVIDVSVSLRVKRSVMCRFMHMLYCVCFHQFGTKDPMSTITKMVRDYQKAEEDLINSGRYDKRDDFTVVIQPFMKFFNAPEDPAHRFDEVIDISYITYDCFHFSQKGHALGANMLWNNLLQPVGFKNLESMNRIMEKFQCPTEDSPYLFTRKNSESFFKMGHQ